MEYRETMRAKQSPDVYAGPECDQHLPQWVGSAVGDKDVDGEIGPALQLEASTFPPGTIVTIKEPVCPHCRSVPMRDGSDRWSCDRDFDWRAWAEETFS